MNGIKKNISLFLDDEQCRIMVRKAGTYRFQNNYIYKAHSHIEYEVNYVTSGNCVMTFGDEYVPLKKNECIVIPPFERHGFLVDTKNGCKIWQAEMSVLLSDRIEKELQMEANEQSHFKIKECEDIVPLIEQIAKLYRYENGEEYEVMLDLAVFQLLLALKRHKARKEDASDEIENAKIIGIMRYLQEHYNEPIQLEEIAEKWNISSRYVRKCFSKEVGMSCTDYITAMRINRAKELMWETNKSITDIAMELGYGTPQYFCKVFKKAVGVSPSAYRSTWREEQFQ